VHTQGLVRVLVVDDHASIRVGIASLVDGERPQMGCVGVASTVSEALAQTRTLQPHVVVLDVDLGGEDGLRVIPTIRRVAPCAVIVLTSLVDPTVATQAQRHGAFACLHKTAPAGDLLAAILNAGPRDVSSLAPSPANAGVALPLFAGTKRP